MNKHKLVKNWLFTKEKVSENDINPSAWSSVTIPHTWNAIDGQDGGNDYYRGLCWYQTSLEVQEHNGRLFIEFEGVNSIATVILNGEHVGIHRGGYSLFRFDITNIAKIGSNVLLVGVDNRHYPDVFPLLADFTFYGGIYRDVHLIYANNCSFDLTDDGSSGVYVSQIEVSKEKASLEIKSLFKNYDFTTALALKTNFIDYDGLVVAKNITKFSIAETKEIVTKLTIYNPRLWNGIKDPYLYTLNIELYLGDKLVDFRNIKTGLRFFSFDHTDFFLNGTKTKLNGVCRHQDRWKIGNALTEEMHNEDMELIKEIGANSIRLAHYQHADYFYDLCDKEGMINWAEIPYITIPSKTDFEGRNALDQLRELIKQNYNHSSILMWGVQNEASAAGKRDNLESIVQKLHDLAKKLDPYRLTTQAQIASHAKKDSMNEITDLLGFNQYFGWYCGEVKDLKSWLKSYRELNPSLPLCLSEYGVEGNTKYHTNNPKTKDYSEEYHALWHEQTYKILETTAFIWGTYVWNMFSFAADFRNEGGVKGINNKGLISFDRQEKRDAFFYYQAKWSKKPILHLTSKRFIQRFQREIVLKAYSNLGEVKFYLNSILIQVVRNADVVFTSEITLKTGKNIVKVTAENLSDETIFITIDSPNLNYIVPPKEKGKGLLSLSEEHNWIDSQVENDEPIIIDSNFYSCRDSIVLILKNEVSTKVLKKYLRPLFSNNMFEKVKNYSIMRIHEIDNSAIPLGLVVKINKELQKVLKLK